MGSAGDTSHRQYTADGGGETTPKEVFDAMSVAEDYLRYVEEQIEAQDEGFRIDSDDKAEWAVRKIKLAQLAIEKRRQFVQAEIERLQAWQQMMDERDQATIDWMTSLLRPYFESLRPQLGKRKSYSLPSGVLQVRTAQVSYARDEEQLLPYARQIGLVKVKESVDWAELKKRLKPAGERPGDPVVDAETGEIVPGVTVQEPEREVFSVKVDVGTEVSE